MQQNDIGEQTDATDDVPAASGELTLTWWRNLRIWWCFLWRSAVAGLLVSMAVGFVLALFLAASGQDEKTAAAIVQLVSLIAALLVGIVAFKSAIVKEYSDFRIALVRRDNP